MTTASRATTTTAAGWLAIAVTVPFIWMAVRNLTLLSGDLSEAAVEQGAVLIGMPLESFGGVLQFLTVVLFVLSAWAVLLGLNVLGRRRWARDAAISTFGLFAL